VVDSFKGCPHRLWYKIRRGYSIDTTSEALVKDIQNTLWSSCWKYSGWLSLLANRWSYKNSAGIFHEWVVWVWWVSEYAAVQSICLYIKSFFFCNMVHWQLITSYRSGLVSKLYNLQIGALSRCRSSGRSGFFLGYQRVSEFSVPVSHIHRIELRPYLAWEP